MLHAQKIIVRGDKKRLLNDISLSVTGGELIALLGPGRAGKSLLLSVLAGDLKPAQGQVWLAGKPIEQWTLRQLAKRRAMLTEQHAHQDIHISVASMVLLGRAPMIDFSPSQQDRAIVQAALTWLHIEDLAKRPYQTLATSERQQVQLARILAQTWGRAKRGDCYVLLDQPTQSLDETQSLQALRAIKQLTHEGAATVVVLNNQHLAEAFCDRIVYMEKGQIIHEWAH